jgi:hypothetical protein
MTGRKDSAADASRHPAQILERQAWFAQCRQADRREANDPELAAELAEWDEADDWDSLELEDD